MKKKIATGVLVLALAAGGLALSPSSDVFARNKEHKGEKMEQFQERRLERMTEHLKLTADQQTKIKAIFDDQKAKMIALREETHRKIEALLTPEQKEKFEKRREERGKPE